MGRKILFITTDQQRYDALGCNGGTIARTPVADAWARAGLIYRRAYNQNTVCMPARSTMLTGQYVRTHGVYANGVALPVDAPSVAAYLAERAGYRTALLGKAHFEPNMDFAGRFEENARQRRGDFGPWRGFERAATTSRLHGPSGGALREVAQAPPSRAPGELRAAARRARWRRQRRAGDQEQSDPAPLVPHRLGGGPHPGVPRFAAHRGRLVRVDELSRSASSVGSAGLRAAPGAVARARSSTWPSRLRRADPRHPGAKAGALAGVLRGPLAERRGRSAELPRAQADARQHPRDQRQGARDERAHRRRLRARHAAIAERGWDTDTT